jgi:inner membrane protein
MPQRATHVAFGVFLFVILYCIFHISFLISFLIAVGAIFPDFDSLYLLKRWHRKLFHNLFVLFLATFTIYTITKELLYSLGFFLGFISHIILDFFTPSGVWFFWPMNKHSIKLKYSILTTGKFSERCFQLIVIFITALIFFFNEIKEVFTSILIAFIITISITIALSFEKRKH